MGVVTEHEAAPTVAKKSHQSEVPFSYTALDSSKNEIRLLRLLLRDITKKSPPKGDKTCEICQGKTPSLEEEAALDGQIPLKLEVFHAELDSKPSFIALSYTWGDPRDPQYPIFLNGHEFYVRRNLWRGLKNLSAYPQEVVIWIDGICIDQSNVPERNSQVRKMKQIYEQASQVAVWLGPADEDSHTAFHLTSDLMQASKHERSRELLIGLLRDEDERAYVSRALTGLSKILTRAYWRRMWIVQELTVAHNIVIWCGGDGVHMDVLLKVQRLLRQMEKGEGGFPAHIVSERLPKENSYVSGILDHGMLAMETWKEALRSKNLSFYQCMLYNADREATDPRDRVFAIADLANGKGGYEIDIDYEKTVAEVYTDLARAEINTTGSLHIMTRIRQGPNPHLIPSWVPDWSFPRLPQHFYLSSRNSPTKFNACGTSKAEVAFTAEGKVITLKAIKLGIVDWLGAETQMDERIDFAEAAEAIVLWWKQYGRAFGEKCSPEAFARTIFCDMFRGTQTGLLYKGKMVPMNASQHILNALSDILYFQKSSLPDGQLESSLEEILRKTNDYMLTLARDAEIPYDVIGERKKSSANLESKCVYLWDRRWLIVNGNAWAIGLGAKQIQKGDIVCVPLGCPHPMILRKSDENYIAIGEAYIDGFMDGEALDMLAKGQLHLETFEVL